MPQVRAGGGCTASPERVVNCPHGGELQIPQGNSWLWQMNDLTAWGPSWGRWHKPNPGDKLGGEAGQGAVRDLGEKGDHGQAMGQDNSTLEILIPPSDPQPTPGMGEAEPNLPTSWGMEQVGSHPHLLAFPLPADQRSYTLDVLCLLLSQDSQDLGLLSLTCKCLSALFGEQDPEQEGRGHALSQALCTEEHP